MRSPARQQLITFEDQPEADERGAERDGDAHERWQIVQRRHPQHGEQTLDPEQAPVEEAEDHGDHAGFAEQDAVVEKPGNEPEQAVARGHEHGTVSDVAEHQPEHEQEADGEESGRLYLAVLRRVVEVHEALKGPQQQRIAMQDRNPQGVVGGLRQIPRTFDVDDGARSRRRQPGTEAFERGLRNPAGDHDEASARAELNLGLQQQDACLDAREQIDDGLAVLRARLLELQPGLGLEAPGLARQPLEHRCGRELFERRRCGHLQLDEPERRIQALTRPDRHRDRGEDIRPTALERHDRAGGRSDGRHDGLERLGQSGREAERDETHGGESQDVEPRAFQPARPIEPSHRIRCLALRSALRAPGRIDNALDGNQGALELPGLFAEIRDGRLVDPADEGRRSEVQPLGQSSGAGPQGLMGRELRFGAGRHGIAAAMRDVDEVQQPQAGDGMGRRGGVPPGDLNANTRHGNRREHIILRAPRGRPRTEARNGPPGTRLPPPDSTLRTPAPHEEGFRRRSVRPERDSRGAHAGKDARGLDRAH
ncbi:MAG TPA: hypothetical protein VD833_16910 [Vicinamibacterales bacterium]|nr:hypothetical protein [Vicinamibacterales bacterium]